MSDYENYLNTTVTITVGYVTFFGIFTILFYIDNKMRYENMEANLVKKEMLKMVTSFGIGEIVILLIVTTSHRLV
ncbi:hypothetical protein [Nitrosopumilus sp.]|uniref:hypothetical protein n=1 Tax=Nitrosopumilus sp. TaxID=2024843 RepID=UPI002931207C|nr:hypothetical protein [Nitrosopumilus sp.]